MTCKWYDENHEPISGDEVVEEFIEAVKEGKREARKRKLGPSEADIAFRNKLRAEARSQEK